MDSFQAPTPFSTNNDVPDNNVDSIILKDINNFTLNYINQNEKILFNIKTGLSNNNIYIFAKQNKDFVLQEYSISISLDSLILKNKQFKSYDFIDEAYKLILKLFQKEKIIVKNYSEKELILEIKLSNLSGEEEAFEILLNKKKISKDILIQELIDKVVFLEEEIKNLKKNQNLDLEKEIMELKNTNQKNEKEIEILKNMLKNGKNIIQKNDMNGAKIKLNYKINSKIITDNSLDFVTDKIKQNYGINKLIELKLLYRGSENNFDIKSFHSKCDKIKGTLTLIKNTKGFIFGGFTSESWEGNNISKKDEKAFCFSVNYEKLYGIIKDKEAIKCNINYGPVFLNDIFGFRKYNLKSGECYIIKNCYYSGCDKDFEINGGKKELSVEEIEIFQIIFE